MSGEWIDVCRLADIDEEDVARFDHGTTTYAVFHLTGGRVAVTDGLCTHAKVHLCGGFVSGTVIECPKHNGRFDVLTGAARGAPAITDLVTYPTRVVGGRVEVRL